MDQPNPKEVRSLALNRAMALVTEALDLLDAHADCPDVSTHLDFALRRLRQEIAGNSTPQPEEG
jgi:hypothetical protein